MRESQIRLFILSERDKFPRYRIKEIKSLMLNMTESQIILVQNIQYTDPNMNFVLSFSCGFLGIDRFIIGQKILGILKLISFGGLGIWWFIDLFFIINQSKEYNFSQLLEIARNYKSI